MTQTPPQLQPAGAQVLVSNIVQLVNESDKDFRMKYGTLFFELGAGKSMFVNEEVAWHFLGRWWTDNANPRQRDRANEYGRLRVLYGAYEDDVAWQASMAMAMKAYAPDGAQITTVVDDPEGTSNAGGQTPFGREMSLESQIEVMRQQVQTLTAEVEAKKRREADLGQEVVPADARPQPSAPFNPSSPAPSPLQQAVGVPLPQAPDAFNGIPAEGNAAQGSAPAPAVDPDAALLGSVGAALPVRSQVAYDPSEADVEEDAPAVVKHTATGGRVAP